jgi:hypothetical protein
MNWRRVDMGGGDWKTCAYSLKVIQHFLFHAVLFEINVDVGDDIVDDGAVYLGLGGVSSAGAGVGQGKGKGMGRPMQSSRSAHRGLPLSCSTLWREAA